MERMKYIIGGLAGVLLAAEAWAGGTPVLSSHVFTQRDSLHIELLLNLDDTKAGNAEAYRRRPLTTTAGSSCKRPALRNTGVKR